jgi:hypothetical protein
MRISAKTTLIGMLTLAAVGIAACDLIGPDASGAVTLAWEAPTTNADGSPLTDLAGYRIVYGVSTPPNSANGTVVDVGNVTTHTLRDLQPGTYYIAVAAVDVSGNVSSLSDEISTEVAVP